MCVQTAEPYIEPPNDVKIEMAVSKLKNGKATGHDQILATLIKGGGRELKKVIYELISKNVGGRDHITRVEIWHNVSNL